MNRGPRIGFGVANVAVAALVSASVFRGLPTRWWVIDGGAAIVSLLLAASGVALVAGARVAERLARVAAAATLTMGLALVLALVASAGWLAGSYGPVGKGGAAIFAIVALLVVPYLVALPAAELVWLGPRRRREREDREDDKDRKDRGA